MEIIDRKLEEYMSIDVKFQDQILDSIKYSLFSGGKRLRAIFAIKSYELFNNNIEEIMPYALAIEMIHTYSLIHDDLPSMDNDDYRREKPTNHRVYGEAMAILSGDGLLNKAFEIIFDDLLSNAIDENDRIKKIKAARLIGKSAGIEGMIGGQVIDVLGENNNMDREKLLYMYETKTGALFKSAIVSGAIIGGASKEELQILEEYSNLLGLSYQIQDDLLDIEEDRDINKTTYLSFYGIEKSQNDLEFYTNKCYELLDSLDNNKTLFLKELTKMLINRKK